MTSAIKQNILQRECKGESCKYTEMISVNHQHLNNYKTKTPRCQSLTRLKILYHRVNSQLFIRQLLTFNPVILERVIYVSRIIDFTAWLSAFLVSLMWQVRGLIDVWEGSFTVIRFTPVASVSWKKTKRKKQMQTLS